MRRMTRRDWLIGSLRCATAFGLAPLLSGCGRVGQTGSPFRGSSITVLYPYDEMVLGQADAMPARFLVFLPLFTWNNRGEFEGKLAESWEYSSDYRTWTVRLRDGVKWHDGARVTARDVKVTYDMFLAYDAGIGDDVPYSVKVLDDRTYSITYRRQSADAPLFDDWMICLPSHVVGKLDPAQMPDWDFWTHPVGNGPYRHHLTVPKTLMEFRANPDYYWGKPKIDRVVLKLVGDTMATAAPELLSGGVDAAPNLNRADALAFADDPRFRSYSHIYNDLVQMLFWNHRHELFSDAKVRRALTYGINRPELLQVLNLPPETPVVDCLCSNRQMRHREFPPAIPYDRSVAAELLDSAGWQKRNLEGMRERHGRPFAFRALLGGDETEPSLNAAIYIQAQLKQLGIKMVIEPATFEAAFPRVVTGDYEAAFSQMFTDFDPDTGSFGNSAVRFLHAAGYRNPRFDAMASNLRVTFNPDEEDRLYKQLATLFQEDVPATFLYPHVYTTVASTRIHGLEDAAYRGDLTWCMDQLWLEERA